MLKRLFVIPLVITFLLSGCAAPHYTEPQNGQTANVRFAVTGKANTSTVVIGFNNGRCEGGEEWIELLANTINVFPVYKRLGIPLWNYDAMAAKEYKMPANKIMNMMILQKVTGNLDSCAINIAPEFKEGKDYEILFNSNNCHTEINEIITPPSQTQSYKRRLIKSFNTSFDKQSCDKEFHRRTKNVRAFTY